MTPKAMIHDLVSRVEKRGYRLNDLGAFITAVLNRRLLTNEAAFETDLATLRRNGVIEELPE